MLLACDCNSFGPHPLEEIFPRIAEAGLSAVELSLPAPENGRGAGAVDPGWLDRSRRLLERHHLQAALVNFDLPDPLDDDWPCLAQARLAAAAELGASLVVVWAGGDTEDGSGGDSDSGESNLRPLQYERLLRLADRAAAGGLRIGLDTRPGLCEDARRMLRTLDDLRHRALGLSFDTGRYLAYNPGSSGEVALQRVCGHLAAVRLRDISGGDGREFPPLGQGGDVDFSRTRTVLEDLAFAGPCSVAFGRSAGRPLSLATCQRWLTESLAHLRGCGWIF